MNMILLNFDTKLRAYLHFKLVSNDLCFYAQKRVT